MSKNLLVKFRVDVFFLLFFCVSEFEKILLSSCCSRIDVVFFAIFFFVLTFCNFSSIFTSSLKFCCRLSLNGKFRRFLLKWCWCCCCCCIGYFLLMFLCLFVFWFFLDVFRKCLWYPYPCWVQSTAYPLARIPKAPKSLVWVACLSSRDHSEMDIWKAQTISSVSYRTYANVPWYSWVVEYKELPHTCAQFLACASNDHSRPSLHRN